MKRNLGIAALVATLAFAGAAVAQEQAPGPGTDTSKAAAGTGNGGDKTTQAGSTKKSHKHRKHAKKTSSDMAASGAQQ